MIYADPAASAGGFGRIPGTRVKLVVDIRRGLDLPGSENAAPRASSVPIESERRLYFFV